MSPPLLALQSIHLTFGGQPLLAGADLSLQAGDRLCLVGRNGSGKSTLLRIAAGLVEADTGERFVQPGTTVRYLPQDPDLTAWRTTFDHVAAQLGPTDDPHRARQLLEALGLTGDETTTTLSGGQARRCALAAALAPDPDILLLDEPTNHLDLPAIEWLEETLMRSRSAFVLISHDRRFLSRLTRKTVWLDRGMARAFDVGFKDFEALRDQILEQEEVDRHKLDRKIVMEEDWLRYGVTARRKRNQKRLADLHALRQRRRTQLKPVGTVSATVADAEQSGKIVIDARHISKALGGRILVRDFSTTIQRGDRVGIVGPNGAGKTTLLNLLTGRLAPDSGEVRLGANLLLAYLDQRRDTLKPDMTVLDYLSPSGDTVTINGKPRHVMGYLKDFLFAPEQARTPVRVLSGGERARLVLARTLTEASNLLVLDEPTNDLDLETLDLLEELLESFSGTILLVSHDRDFLDRVVTSVIAFEEARPGMPVWTEYAGGYSDMLTQRKEPAPAPTTAPSAGASRPRSSAPTAPVKKRKLSFHEKHALETLPERIENLLLQRDKLQSEMSNPDLFARNPDRFARVVADLEQAEKDLQACEDEWLRLELLREELDSSD